MKVTIERAVGPPPDDMLFRGLDLMEFASAGLTVADHFEGPTVNFTVSVEGVVVAIWGFRPLSRLGLQAAVWMVSTPAIERYPVVAARTSLELVAKLLSEFPVLVCWVDPDYALARRWLEWLGFRHTANLSNFLEMRVRRH